MKKLVLFIIIILFFINVSSLLAETIWRDDFEKVENWKDNNLDPSFNAVIYASKYKIGIRY